MSTNRSSKGKFSFSREFFCQLCEKEYLDPRVLPCLHCFCSQCLQELVSEQNPKPKTSKPRNDWFHGFLGEYLPKDNCIKREYEKISSSLENKTFSSKNSTAIHEPGLKCPICGFFNKLPPKGVQDLPPHYLLQHRMLLDTLNKEKINFFCDLCLPEILATSRCTKCLLNLCNDCLKSHKRKKQFSGHKFTKLEKKGKNGSFGISKISRQVMCPSHRDSELKYYCSSCSMVACNECCIQFHSDHDYELFSKAVQKYTSQLSDGLGKTRSVSERTTAAIKRLCILSEDFESRYCQIQKEINNHIDRCIEAFEKHRENLLAKAKNVKCEQMDRLDTRKKELLQKAQDINHILKFGNDLLNEGSDFEILSFALYLLQRLEWCIKFGDAALTSAFANCYETLQFLSKELSETELNKTLLGVVTTKVVSPSHCHFTPGALEALQNCRVKQLCELTLITKNSYDQQLTHGAEGIEVSLKSHNSSNKNIPICIVDLQNGLYVISFTPEVTGKLSLSVSIRGIPIKGNPFSVIVRTEKVHAGTFHCCILCSRKSSQNDICGCSNMKSGCYEDYGHKYIGRFKEPYWSCCKNTMLNSERVVPSHENSDLYHLKF